MDFRSAQPQTAAQPAVGVAPSRSAKHGNGDRQAKWLRIATVALLFCLTVLVLAAIVFMVFAKPASQSTYLQKNKYQAVFLTNGQVYFGNVNDVNKEYIHLKNIYYLTQATSTDSSGNSTATGNYTLVKLGCQQIHDPIDEMVIDQSQVSFWENLNDSGKVVTSIKQFIKQNPNGPDCSQVSSQTQASNSGNTGTPQGTGATKQ